MKTIAHHTSKAFALLHKHVMKHKKYHHYFLLSLIALSAGFFLYNKAVHVHAATYNFQQTGWEGGLTSNTATHVSNQSNWKQYTATSTGVAANASVGVSLSATNYSVTDDGTGAQIGSNIATVGTSGGYSVSPYSVVYDPTQNAVWVSSQGGYTGGILQKFNATTGAKIGSDISSGYAALVSATYDSTQNAVWVISGVGVLQKYNAVTGAQMGSNIQLNAYSSFTSGAIAYDPTQNAIWVANSASSTLQKFNAATGAQIGGSIATIIGNNVVYDRTQNAVWVTGVVSSTNSTLQKFNAATGAQIGSTIITINSPYYVSTAIVYDSAQNAVWVGLSYTGYYLQKYNAATGAKIGTDILPGGLMQGLSYDSQQNAIWATNVNTNKLQKFNAATGAQIGGSITLAGNAGAVAYDSTQNAVWVADGSVGGPLQKFNAGANFESGTFSSTVVSGAGSAASVRLAPAIFATGGAVTISGAYTTHKFTSTDTVYSFTPTQTIPNAEYLVVAGGGGGGNLGSGGGKGGGGGGGGMITGTATDLPVGVPVTVVVGASAASSSFGTIMATHGGSGGGYGAAGTTGGSGGGGGVSSGSTAGGVATTTPVQGTSGGTANTAYAGGGGGYAVAGTNASPTSSGPGGAGGEWPAGSGVYYAGGGGGGGAAGGIGGGGAGGSQPDGFACGIGGVLGGSAGLPNTGGGGGGGNGYRACGGYGGTGVVIVRYSVYELSGTFTSAVINTGAKANFTTLSVASTTPANTSVTMYVRAWDTASSTDGTWPAWSGTSVANGGDISGIGQHQYVQYKAVLTTTNTAVTPTLDSVTINYSQYAPSGNLTSSKYDTNSDANLISNISWNATATDTDEVVKFQLRSASTSALLNDASSTWCGPTACGAGADYFTNSTGSSVLTASTTHPLKTGGDDRWLQYKVFLTSGGDITPILNNVTVQYVVNAPPDFDTSYGNNGVSANQISNSADNNFGKIQISYAVRDIDGDTGNTTANYVKPTFEYSLDNGSTWNNISTSTLIYSSQTGLSTYQGNTTNLIATSTYTTYIVYWDEKSQGIATSTANAKIRITINDNEAANNTASAISSAYYLDTMAPTGGIIFDAGVAGQINSAIINIRPNDATTSVQYLITDDSSNSNASSTGWVNATANATTTISWTFDADIEAKTLRFQFRDAYGNTTATTTLTTIEPIPSTSFLIQDTSSLLSTPPTYGMYIGWQSSTSTIFADYELEYATSTNNSNYGPYSEVAEITNVNTIYYVHNNLNPAYFYRYRFGVRDTNGNTSVRPTIYTTAHANGAQDYGEGGGGTSLTAPVMKNVSPVQGSDGKVTVSYTLTDTKYSTKQSTGVSYEGYIFYDNGVTVVTSSANTITVDDASKMPSSGFIQIKDEVIKYTSKTGNVLDISCLTCRGVWPTDGTARTTTVNTIFFANTPVWIMASSTSPILITPDTNVPTGLAGTIVWDISKESTLAGSIYSNVGIRVLVHDNQASGSGPITTQNISSDDGKLLNLNVSVPTIEFISVATSPMDQSIATTSDKFKVKLSKAYPFDVTFSYALSGTAENNGVDYTMATTTVTIPAGATTTNIYADITPSNSSNISVGDKTIIITLNSPTNAILGTNISSVYTIHNSYINPPGFAQAPVISQITSGNDLGKVLIAYSVRDVDAGNSTNGVSNIATSTFKYSLDNGVTWVTITNLSSGSLDGKTVDAVTYTTLSGTFASTTDSTTALWDVASQLATSTNNLKIKVTTTAGTIKPTSAATTSNSISLDAKKPEVTLNLNLSTGTTSLNISDDNIISYKISNNSDLSSDSVNALSTGNWINVGATSLNSPSTVWTFNSLTNPKVYYSVKDTLGNTVVTTSNSAPAPIANVQLKDVSNVSLNTYGEVLTWDPFVATTTSAFGKYQIYRATSTDANYSLLSEIINTTTISYRDNTVASSTMYYYKLLAVDDDGDTSGYSNMVNDTPDGSSGSAVVLNITNASTTDIMSNSVTITWTTNEYATSTVEYSDPGTVGVFSNSVTSSVLSKTHSITLSNLISGASYTYQIKSTDIADSTVTDHNGDTGYYSFTTKGGPRITNVHTTQGTLTDTTASIFWDTNILSDSDVYYSTNSLTVNSATSSVHLRDATATTSHQIDITGLSQATTYYFKVVSASAEDATLTSTDDNKNTTYPFNVQFHTFTTLGDNVAPTISNISVPVKSPTSAVIVWTTNELATSQVQWGTSSSTLDHSSTLDSFKVLNHNVSISGLTSEVTYYFKVLSIDNSSHATSSEIQSFTTTKDGVVIVIQVVSSSGNGTQDDATPPVIISSGVDVKSIGSFNADVKVETDEPVRAFVTYGETTNYGSTEGDNTLSASKTISLKKLKTGTDYHYRVQVIDKAGNDVTSADKTFKTKFISELLDDRAFVDKADDLQGKIEQLLESALPSLSPPYVSTPVISNITENGVTINWNTNIKTIGSLSYATDEDYTAKNTYGLDVSTGLDKSASHNVDLVNLKSNTKYHIQAKSYVFPQVMGKSADITFVTKAAKVKADILEKKKDGFTVAWSTDEPTTSIVEYKNLKTGETNRTADNTKKTYHAVKIENLPSATSYTVKVSGVNGNDNTIEAADAIDVTTSSDTIPPTISNFKVDNALVPGRTDRIQTVVGWQTDEPANSVVYYQEGAGTPGDTAELSNKVESLDNYTANHIMILASLKPGAIYRLKVISTDEGGNAKVFGPRTIITPRQTESVLDIIFKNFEDTFKFLRQ